MQLDVQLIPLSDEESWHQALKNLKHTYAHTHWYNQAMHLASKRDIYLFHAKNRSATCENNYFEVICPISPRRQQACDQYDITTPYGFSGFAFKGQFSDFQTAWFEFMHSKGFVCGHLALNPLQNITNFNNKSDLFAGKQSYYLNLTIPSEQLFQNFSMDHRQRLRQWGKRNYQITSDKTELILESFMQQYAASLAARGAATIYNFGEAAWRIILTAPASSLFSLIEEGKATASALFIEHDDTVDYFMIASTPNGRQHARGLIWHAIQYYQQRTMKWLHLGCGIRENDELEQFKARFGAKPFTTYALKQIYMPTEYEMLCKKYETETTSKEGYFPSYWSTNLNVKESS